MKVLFVFVVFVVSALAAPQDFEGDAELVPRRNTGGGGFPAGDGEGVLVVVPVHNPFTRFFNHFFSSRRDTDGGASELPLPSVFGSGSENAGGSRGGGLWSLITKLFNTVPSPSNNATVTFQNNTVEEVTIGGVPMLLNRTITEYTGDNGSLYRKVEQRLIPVQENAGPSPTPDSSIPAADNEANEVISETSDTQKHSLQKRWIVSWLKDTIKKGKPSTDTASSIENKHSNNEDEPNYNRLIPIENESDIAVNYLGNPPVNPDAEVFDPNLVRESERSFWEARENSLNTQPIRSNSRLTQPLRSNPITSQPLRAAPIMSQPLRSSPMMSQPLRASPRMSQPLRVSPRMSQPLRSNSKMSQPLRSSPKMSQPLRSYPRMSQPLRSSSRMDQPLRSNPRMSLPLRSRSVRL